MRQQPAHPIGDAGGSQRDRNGREDATTTETTNPNKGTRQGEAPRAAWQRLMDGLTDVEGDLNAPNGHLERPLTKTREAIRMVRALWTQAMHTPHEEWMARIERKIDTLADTKSKAKEQTWAQVAAQHATRMETTCKPQRHARTSQDARGPGPDTG